MKYPSSSVIPHTRVAWLVRATDCIILSRIIVTIMLHESHDQIFIIIKVFKTKYNWMSQNSILQFLEYFHSVEADFLYFHYT